ncbi:MAG: MCE family protein [Elusimicrobia bacterium]|nr:MCE family protein [Elusimicrobiota bacterium]
MDIQKSDAAVGALVIGACAVFAVAAFAINRARFSAATYPLYINLPQMAGIDKGDEVFYQGYKAGTVDQIRITYQPRLRFNVRMAMKNEIRLRHGANVVVRGRGFGGARYLEIAAPESEDTREIFESDTLPAVLDADLMYKANEVMGDAHSVLHVLQKEGTAAELSQAAKRLNRVLANLDRTLTNVNGILEEDRASLKVTLEHTSGVAAKADERLPAILADLQALVADLKKHPWRLVRKGEPTPDKPEKPEKPVKP